MNITEEKGELVLRIPLKQKIYNLYDEEEEHGETDNLVGIVAGNEYSISYLIDLAYKDSQQEGMSIIMFDTEEELRKVCTEMDIDVWTHPVCSICKKVIRGTMIWGDKGAECLEHEKEPPLPL